MSTKESINLGELIRDEEIPVRRLSPDEVTLISNLIQEVYVECIYREPISATTGDENSVSNLIRHIMTEKIENDPSIFTIAPNVEEGLKAPYVVEGKNYIYDGTGRPKFPDIFIWLSKPDYKFPVTLEAKIIDDKKTLEEKIIDDKKEKRSMRDYMRDYCEDGISRFIEGHYSWWSDDGFMIAYVRNNSDIQDLEKFLDERPPKYKILQKNNKKITHKNYWKLNLYKLLKCKKNISILNKNLGYTNHERDFNIHLSHEVYYPNPINIYHIWLDNGKQKSTIPFIHPIRWFIPRRESVVSDTVATLSAKRLKPAMIGASFSSITLWSSSRNLRSIFQLLASLFQCSLARLKANSTSTTLESR